MLECIIIIFAIYGLTFLARQTDGPWNIINWIRRKLISNEYVGAFFFKLLDCPYCSGFHAGWVVYLLTVEHYKLTEMLLWALAGGTVGLILDGVVNKLHQP